MFLGVCILPDITKSQHFYDITSVTKLCSSYNITTRIVSTRAHGFGFQIAIENLPEVTKSL